MDLQYLEVDHERESWARLSDERREAFIDRLIPHWLYHEHALEGVPLAPEAIRRSLEDKPCRNYCDAEVKRSLQLLAEAIDHVVERARGASEPTVDWFEQLHRRLSVGEVEEPKYRARGTSPGVYNLDIVEPDELPGALEAFVDTYDTEYGDEHPVRGAALSHWELMHIFPFDERTGLVARMAMNVHLISHGYPPAVIHAEDRHHYFQALRDHRDELVPVVVAALEDVLDSVRAFDDDSAEVDQTRLFEFGDPATEGRQTL